VLDAERRRGRAFGDAVLFALLFVPIVRARVHEIAPDGDPDPNRLATVIEEVVAPLGLRMSLPRATTDRIKQALGMVGRLSHRPDSKLATRRIAFREAFATALELFELTAMATGRGQDLAREWRAVHARIERARSSARFRSRRSRRRGGEGAAAEGGAPGKGCEQTY
jgi:poly(A) polymerase